MTSDTYTDGLQAVVDIICILTGHSTSESDVFVLMFAHDDHTTAKIDMLRQGRRHNSRYHHVDYLSVFFVLLQV